jgi:translocation and assembly module TamB
MTKDIHPGAGHTFKRVLRLALKICIWFSAIVLALLFTLILTLRSARVQTYLTQKATHYISGKIKSKVSIGTIAIAFPKSVVLHDVYVEDLKKDTLLKIHALKIDMDLFALFSKKITLNDVEIEQLTSHIRRLPNDSVFNYSFIADAFSSPPGTVVQKKKTSPPSSAWIFSIKQIGLKDIRFTYCDAMNGLNTGVVLGAFDCVLDTFDLAKRIIHVESADLKNTVASVILMPFVQRPETQSTEPPFRFGLSKIVLASLKTRYENKTNGQNMLLDLGKLRIDMRASDINSNSYSADRLELSGTHFSYVLNKTDSGTIHANAPQAKQDEKKIAVSWFLSLKKLSLEDNTFAYDNKNSAASERGMDFNHLLLSHVRIDCQDLVLSPAKVSLDLRQMQVKEKCGLDLKQFQTLLSFDSTHLTLDHLDLQTDKSKIGPYLSVRYSSLNALKDSIGKLYLKADLLHSNVAISDILLFNPSLLQQPFFAKNSQVVLHVQSTFSGPVENLSIPRLELTVRSNTTLKLKGSIQGLPDIDKTFASLELTELTTGKKDLEALLPEGILPGSFSVPDSIRMKAQVTGYLKNFNADLDFNSSFGGFKANVRMNPAAGNQAEPYSVDLNLTELNAGKFLNQPDILGPVTLTANLNGSGLDTNTLNAQLHLVVQTAFVKNYAYKNLLVDGKFVRKSFEGTASTDSKDLAFAFAGKIDLNSRSPLYIFQLDLKKADLTALHFSQKELAVSGVLSADMHAIKGKNMTGKISFLNGIIVSNKKDYPLDSIILTSTYSGDVAEVRLRSKPIMANFKGTFNVAELPAAISEHFKTYFNPYPVKQKLQLANQTLDFKINLHDPGILADLFIPDLQFLLPSVIKGAYSSGTKKLDMDLLIPQVIYADNKLDTVKIGIHANSEKLNYSIRLAEVSGSLLKMENISLAGAVSNNVISYQLNSLKDDSSKMIAIGGILKHRDSVYELHLNPDLVLNKSKWEIDPSNAIRFEKLGTVIHQLTVSRAKESISVNSTKPQPNAELQVKFNNFLLTDISRIIESEDSLIKGVIDGSLVLKQHGAKAGFTSDLTLKNLVYKGSMIGDVALHADNEVKPDQYNLTMKLSGNQNDLNLVGYYVSGTKNDNLHFDLDIPNLNLASIEPFAFHQVTEMTGSIDGKLKISGTPASPDVTGALNFKKAGLNPGIIDSYLTIDNASLVMESQKITFKHFTLKDSLNNPAFITGYVDIHDLTDIRYDMHLKTTNFLALNTKRSDNPLYFGKIYLSSDISVKGDMDHPVVDVKARLNKGSSITYVKPDDQLADQESKGIVEFPDTLVLQNRPRTRKTASAHSKNTSAKGMDLNATIEIDRDTKLKMLVDPISGDSLIVRGDATLDFSMDRSNKTSLTGTYTVYSGSYHLTLNEFVKRDFKLDKGSQITWSGDATDAYLNLSAIYKVKTAPLDLLEAQLAGESDAQKNVYRTNLDFLVYLKMKGTLESPEISFDIQQQDDQRGALNGSVDARLNQIREDPNEMNKQVFSLLTLNRFIAEDPMASSGGGDPYSSAARSSASKLLSQQLNKASGKYVKEVDLNLGLESYDDYSSGQQQGRTQVKIGVTKQLFKDKVSVQVGGNVDVEGQKAKENNASEIAGNVLVEYKLTDDARFKLKMFRKNEYENPIEGELTKTGMGILFTKDYNKIKELFIRRPRKKKTKLKE